MTEETRQGDWRSTWPDAIAFAGGLFVAWWGQWRATDLVWSLWLSSLVVGYALILWSAARPVLAMTGAMAADRADVAQIIEQTNRRDLAIVAGFAIVGGLFVLAFITMHFFGFHYVHSQFLSMLFPIDGTSHPFAGGDRMAMYRVIFRRYWIFLPAAFLAERGAFAGTPPAPPGRPSVTAEAIAKRKMALLGGGGTWEPYKKVMRMHFLILFFVLAHFAHLENFAVYAVVYAVYFFPWRLLNGSGRKAPLPAAS